MFDLNKLQVAKPCHVGWETMSGDERSRHCSQCQLNVYNIAGLTAPEAQHLIETREGRVCIRLVRRTDGTVLTKDCPVGIRKYRACAARYAGAALATILGVFSVSYGQKNDKNAVDASKLHTIRKNILGEKGEIKGVITDLSGAVIRGISVTLISPTNEKTTLTSNTVGEFVFEGLQPLKSYILMVEGSYGFKRTTIKNLHVSTGISTRIQIPLVASTTEIVGIFMEEPLIDTRSSTVETVITADKIRRIPN